MPKKWTPLSAVLPLSVSPTWMVRSVSRFSPTVAAASMLMVAASPIDGLPWPCQSVRPAAVSETSAGDSG